MTDSILQKQLQLLLMLHEKTAQAYHAAAGIIMETAHQAPNWKDCDMDTCRWGYQTLKQIQDLGNESGIANVH